MPAGSQAKLPTPAGPQPITSSYGAIGRSAACGCAYETAISTAPMNGMRMGGMLTRPFVTTSVSALVRPTKVRRSHFRRSARRAPVPDELIDEILHFPLDGGGDAARWRKEHHRLIPCHGIHDRRFHGKRSH